MDNNLNTSSSSCQNHTYLPWRSTQNYHTSDSHTCTPLTTSMQCHITVFSPATMLWITWDHYKHLNEHTANLNAVNISVPEFWIWQHLKDHCNGNLLHHLVNIPSVPTDKFYKQMITSNEPMNPFLSTDESMGEQSQSGHYFLIQESMQWL